MPDQSSPELESFHMLADKAVAITLASWAIAAVTPLICAIALFVGTLDFLIYEKDFMLTGMLFPFFLIASGLAYRFTRVFVSLFDQWRNPENYYIDISGSKFSYRNRRNCTSIPLAKITEVTTETRAHLLYPVSYDLVIKYFDEEDLKKELVIPLSSFKPISEYGSPDEVITREIKKRRVEHRP